WIRR
ncbi:acetyl-coenzyme A carboxylase carboxyl transferase subunit beta, partial [Vibrio parahaemolyticus IDH02640]